MAGIGTENLVSLNTLVFGSLEFLFRYLPVFLLIFCIVPHKYRDFVLFLYSLVLYGMGEPGYVFLLFGMTAVNYLFGRSLEKIRQPDGTESGKNQKRRKNLFRIAIACNILLLVYFKLSNVFDTNFLLPVGISFYIFKSISYLTDVYRVEIDVEDSFIRFGAYLCNFTQIVSGPIMRYRDAQKGLKYGKVTPEGMEAGLKTMVLGLCAKVLIADRLAILWNDICTIGFESISTPLAWLGAVSFSLQLYFDFAGYSLMAVGIGEMIGLPMIQNFHYPYAARSVSEFYRRWHMTLGSWFKDYVYIPLGGNRRGTARTLGNLLAVWLLTGFWHGSSFNFVIWGLLLFFFIMLEKLWLGKFLKRHILFSHIYLLLVIPLTWIVFAVKSLPEIGVYFTRLFPFIKAGTAVNPADFGKEIGIFAPTLAAAVFFSIPAVGKWYEKHKNSAAVVMILFVLFWFAVYQIANAGNNPFMYANF